MSAADWSRPGPAGRGPLGGHAPATVTSGTAGWALAWSLLGCCYVGNILSTVLALRVLAHRRATGEDRGSGLAVAALAVNAVAVGMAVLAAYLWVLLPDEDPSADEPVDTVYDALREVNADTAVVSGIDDLSWGDCVVVPEMHGEQGAERRVDCEETHDVEVIDRVLLDDLGNLDFPGDAALERRGKTCRGKTFVDYVGIPLAKSELEVTWLVPDEDDWEFGDRVMICIARDPAGPLRDSLYEARR